MHHLLHLPRGGFPFEGQGRQPRGEHIQAFFRGGQNPYLAAAGAGNRLQPLQGEGEILRARVLLVAPNHAADRIPAVDLPQRRGPLEVIGDHDIRGTYPSGHRLKDPIHPGVIRGSPGAPCAGNLQGHRDQQKDGNRFFPWTAPGANFQEREPPRRTQSQQRQGEFNLAAGGPRGNTRDVGQQEIDGGSHEEEKDPEL